LSIRGVQTTTMIDDLRHGTIADYGFHSGALDPSKGHEGPMTPSRRPVKPRYRHEASVPLTVFGSRSGKRFPDRVRVRLRIDQEGEMSLQLSAKAPARILSSGSDEPRASSRHNWGRNDVGDGPNSFGLACRDVIDEVRQRMADRGYRWD
jgi:hypothetical protein